MRSKKGQADMTVMALIMAFALGALFLQILVPMTRQMLERWKANARVNEAASPHSHSANFDPNTIIAFVEELMRGYKLPVVEEVNAPQSVTDDLKVPEEFPDYDLMEFSKMQSEVFDVNSIVIILLEPIVSDIPDYNVPFEDPNGMGPRQLLEY